jgi:AAA family ATP:ADP antiporter
MYSRSRFLWNCFLVSNITEQIKSSIPPANERKKLLPLGLMFFCILFNYTILRDTKDVLMVTAPKSGAEVIPFIKTYVNLPAAIVSNTLT